MIRRGLLITSILGVVASCAPGVGNPDDATPSPTLTGEASPTPTGQPCYRDPAPENRDCWVVTSHPYDADGNQANGYRVWMLSQAGMLSRTDTTFEMGRSLGGEVVFTPDGELGFVAQDDGTLGVFRIDALGAVEVLHAAFPGSFWVSGVAMDPRGHRLYVLDGNWRENDGGIYGVEIGCDDSLTESGLLAASKLAYGLAFLPGTSQALLAADDVMGSLKDRDIHLLDLDAGAPVLLDEVDAYPDDEAIVSALAVTGDSRYGLVGDNSFFSGIPNRVGVVSITGDKLAPVQVLPGIEDPMSIVVSPFDDAALVVSGFGDAVVVLGYDPANTSVPFTNLGEPAYTGASPQLPSTAVLIGRGDLSGTVLLVENVGVRVLTFDGAGGVVDDGALTFAGLDSIVGSLGIQR